MKAIGAVVLRQMKHAPIEGKLSPGDSVAVAPDARAKVRFVCLITIQVVIAQNDIGNLAVAIGDSQGDNVGTLVDDGDLLSSLVCEYITVNGLSEVCISKVENPKSSFHALAGGNSHRKCTACRRPAE